MSIVQDALKKVKNNRFKGESKEKEEAEETIRLKANLYPLRLTIVILSLFLLSFSLVYYLNASKRNERSLRGKIKPTVSPPAQDTRIALEIKEEIKEPFGQALKPSTPIETKPQYPELILNGIMYLETGPRAIINGDIVEEGAVMSGGVKVLKINRDGVIVNFDGAEIKLNLK